MSQKFIMKPWLACLLNETEENSRMKQPLLNKPVNINKTIGGTAYSGKEFLHPLRTETTGVKKESKDKTVYQMMLSHDVFSGIYVFLLYLENSHKTAQQMAYNFAQETVCEMTFKTACKNNHKSADQTAHKNAYKTTLKTAR